MIAFTEEHHERPARRWLYRLSEPVRFSSGDLSYAEGNESTEYVVVSWGRDGDTGIFPADPQGRILDFFGWNVRMGWADPTERMNEWVADMSEVAA